MHPIRYRKDIDALRGISVLLVVIYHAFPNFLPGGFVGVDVFFVISGYLITSIIIAQLKENRFSFPEFYKRRIRRIFPSLLTVIFASLVVGWLVLYTDEYKQLGNHAFHSIIFIQNFTLIEELGYFDVSSHYKPFLHLWTLSIEEQYYLIWPAILFLLFRFKFSASVSLITIIVLSFASNIYFAREHTNDVFYHSLTRIWELGIGSLLGVYLSNGHSTFIQSINQKTAISICFAGLALILTSAFQINDHTLYPYWTALLPTLGAALIILANTQLNHWSGLAEIGLISYPLYLWHWVIISFFYIYLGKQPSVTLLLFAIILSLFLAYLTTKYIEKARYSKSKYIVISLLSIAMLIGFGGKWVHDTEGVPDRAQLNYLTKYNVEFKRPPPRDEPCNAYVTSALQAERTFEYCRTNIRPDTQKLVVITGDSHAHTLFPGIAKVATQHGYETMLLANSSCPPLIGFMWGKHAEQIAHCQNRINQILTLIEREPRIEKVIIATRGPTYIHGEVEGNLTKFSVTESLSTFKSSGRLTYKTYFDGYERSLSKLSGVNHVKDIYYILENPELDFLPKEAIPRPLDYWGISVRESTISRSLYQLRMKNYRSLALEKTAMFPKASIVDLEPYLCEEDRCFSFKGRKSLYADDDHLSISGSHYIAKSTEEIIFRK